MKHHVLNSAIAEMHCFIHFYKECLLLSLIDLDYKVTDTPLKQRRNFTLVFEARGGVLSAFVKTVSFILLNCM